MGTFSNVAIIFLLKSPEYFNIPANEIGRVSNNIIFYGLLFQIIMSLFVGYIYELLGRRLTLSISVLAASVVVAFIPYVSPSLTSLIGIRLFIAITFCALSSQPLINDYVAKETRGRAIAIQNMGIIIGDLLTFVVVLNLTKNMSAYN